MSDLTPPVTPTDATPPSAPTRRARLIALIASGAALLVVIAIVIAFAVIPRGEPVALVDEQTPTARASAAPTARVTPTPTVSPTPVGAAPAPVAAPAPAPGNPAPANPAPAKPAPVLPAPPAPVIPPLKIDAMDATATTPCGPQGHILISWSASGAKAGSANMNVRSGGGTPVFNQSWVGYEPVDHLELFTVDCTRPIWFFTLTVSNGTTTKTGRLTFSNGKNVGWSSVAP